MPDSRPGPSSGNGTLVCAEYIKFAEFLARLDDEVPVLGYYRWGRQAAVRSCGQKTGHGSLTRNTPNITHQLWGDHAMGCHGKPRSMNPIY